jgi:lipopolysaccharide transport system ATP-binding protein
MTDSVVSVTGISKKFSRSLRRSLLYGMSDIASELVCRPRRSSELRPGEFWALKDINFEVGRGTGVGLIGPNGSGKTTLLRLLTGLIKPDQGRIRVRGKAAPLIALGAGFNPVLTGRENVFINMAMLGMSHAQTRASLDEVLDFAEIGDAIDAPLQTYSSGMAARLGFACAIHTSPDVILVDEVLSVGDMRFRAKCYRKLAEMRDRGVGFVLVSHNLNSVLAMTQHVLYLRAGREIAAGDPVEVVTRYEEDMAEQIGGDSTAASAQASGQAATDLRIAGLRFEDEHGQRITELRSSASARLVIDYLAERSVDNLVVTLLVREMSDELELVLNLNSDRDGVALPVAVGPGRVELEFPHTVLGPGLYVAKLLLGTRAFHVFDAVEAFRFLVRPGKGMAQCALYQPRSWRVMQTEPVSVGVEEGREA